MAEKKVKDLFDTMTEYKKGAGVPTKETSEEPLKQRQIRMSDAEWKALKAAFRRRGLSISAGIRMVLHDYLERERIP